MEPHDYRIYFLNIDLRHQYWISVAESQTFLRAKLHQRRRARRNKCFRRLTWQHPEQDLEGVCTWTGSHYLWHLQPVVKEGVYSNSAQVLHRYPFSQGVPAWSHRKRYKTDIPHLHSIKDHGGLYDCARLLPQLEDKIDPRQYARKGHSTLDALLYKTASSDIRGGGHAVVRHVLGSFSLISLRDLILLITLF